MIVEGNDEDMTGVQESDLPQGRANSESHRWAEEKHARLEARLSELIALNERQKEILGMPHASLVAGIERWYSAPETARFFARTPQWIYDRIREDKFRYRDGEVIKPHQDKHSVTFTRVDPETGLKEKVTEERLGPYRFNLPIIKEIAQSCYRAGTIKMDELKVILLRVVKSEDAEMLYDPDEE